MSQNNFNRPALAAALAEWKKILAQRGVPETPLWIFAENLCIERGAANEKLRVGFQTRFTPPDEDALEIAYDFFGETGSRMVFYRLGSVAGKSVCLLLCDSWFEDKKEADGFARRDEWGVSFYAGDAQEIEEITDLARWVRRVRRDRAFQDFDFSLSLATIDELRMHGRPLLPYEHFAQKMLGRLKRLHGQE